MSDTAPPVQPAGLSSEQVASMRESWVAAGHDPMAFDAAAGTAPPREGWAVQPPRDDAGRFAAPSATPSATGPQLTIEQAQALAEALLNAGVDHEMVAKAASEHGVIPDTRSDEDRANDKAWGMDKLVDPSEYQLNYVGTQVGLAGPAKAQEFDGQAREWLTGMQAMPGEGQFLIERALQVGREHAGWSQGQKDAWNLTQRYQLEAKFGEEGAAEQIRLAGYALRLAGAGSPFHEALRSAGTLNDQFIVRTLANVGRRIEQWSRGSKP